MDLSRNALVVELPACVSILRRLQTLVVSHNRLTALPRDLGLRAGSRLRTVYADENRIGMAGLPSAASADSSSQLTTLWLNGNPIYARAMYVVERLQSTYPQLAALHLSRCGIFQGLIDKSPLTTLEVAGNPLFKTSSGVSLPQMEELDLSGTDIQGANALPASIQQVRTFRIAGTAFDGCIPATLLRSRTVRSIDVRNTSVAFNPGCLAHTLDAVRSVQDQRRYFPGQSLTCPQWAVKSSDAGGFVDADAGFLLRERCRCLDGMWWNGTGCDGVPAGALALVRADPYVLRPRSCVAARGVYPVDAATGALPASAARLPAARMLACRRAGACGGEAADACLSLAAFNDSGHGHRDTEPDANDLFSCAAGHDRSSLLCSRCAEGYWRSGDACVACQSAAFAVLVPFSLAAALAAFLVYAWRRSGRASNGYRTLSAALFWLQATALLEASAQVQAGARSTTTWGWVAATRGAVDSWAVLRPWAFRCVAGDGWDFVSASFVVLAGPAAVACVGAAASALVQRPDLRQRVRHVTAFLLL